MPVARLTALSILAAAAALLAGAAPALAGGPGMLLGAAEDVVRAPDLVTARAKMSQLRLAGFGAVRVTSNWQPGLVAPTAHELGVLRNIEAAARLSGIRVYVSVYHPGSRTTPLEPTAQAEFAQYAAALAGAIPSFDDVIVGNEPNLNRFWLPQFATDGTNASAPAYLQLLSRTYDALKAVDPGLRVWGGALAPRGSDRPEGTRHTSSPTAFLQALGRAYRGSGRTLPVMDGLAFHPYPDNSSQSPDFPHPRSTTIGLADYGKLVALLAEAFDGTAQPGSSLPILYDEFGIESIVPEGKRSLYSGNEPTTTRPVDEYRQAAAYDLGLRLAFCQPNVAGVLLFHSHDEQALGSWQSGVYYADGAPKASFWAVRDSLDRARGGSIARCDGLALDVALTRVRFPGPREFLAGKRETRFRCTLDCAWELTATRATGAVAARVRGYGRWGRTIVASLTGRKLGHAAVRLTLTVTHPVNPGAAATRVSGELRPA
jgi:hypothetical protein